MITIEKGVPIPPIKMGRYFVEINQVKTMRVGDSFVESSDRPYANLHTQWGRIFKRAGYKMTTRKENGHIQVWRVA